MGDPATEFRKRAEVKLLKYIFVFTALALVPCGGALAEPFSINDALKQAVRTNPGVGEASANRRATESELRQTQSTLLPQVRVEARWGPEKFDQSAAVSTGTALPVPIVGNGSWRNGSQESVVVRQILFDGFASIHDIWRQTARVNAAAFRVRERTELIALDAAEAYVDVVRYLRLVTLSEQNVVTHEKIFSNVNTRFSGGRAGEGDLEQARERVENARATLAEFRRSLEESRARFRKVVGLEPINLRFPGPLGGLPTTRDEALATTVRFNPTIQAAQADADAAKHAFRVTDGAFVPTFSLEGRATHNDNTYPYLGVTHDDYSGKVVMSWDVFRGGQDVWRRSEMSERYVESTARHARLQRDAIESIDKAWAARTVTVTRIAALTRQLEADRKTIAAFQKEYELGQRSLIDLLNAQNQYFNALVSLTSARGVVVFADYQLLAAMGTLLEYLKSPPPVDAAPVDLGVFGTPDYKAPTLRVKLPQTGSEPLNVPVPAPERVPARLGYASEAPEPDAFKDRWPTRSNLPTMVGASEWITQQRSTDDPVILNTSPATAYAADRKPHWLATAFEPVQR
ncbi:MULTISPECIES: TolC family outer membrane protein [Bradyrhizobium]|uniref:TolC family outer membrane protein n=1 Tax=Bradyrhizobium TaxID=374 RepID=UPI000D731B02|nr:MULTISPECIES: TolC family outer membrane protein [Bradyrhizobium]AWO92284.1 TolC family outer membrane protein [Bradyrhizobium diazoefficiens]MDA9389936.1 membrane protein [Bradyrhizobium sp. CCBAU 45394]